MNLEKIYIIHGLWGFPLEFFKIEKKLSRNGYKTDVFSYNSVTKDIRKAAKKLYEKIKSDNEEKISIITFSMGGLVFRALLALIENDRNFPTINRAVMIAPPNRGAVSANLLYERAFYRFVMGVNLKHICTFTDSHSQTLPLPKKNIEIGIIAGIFKNDNDGEIKLEETKLGTENDFVTVKSHHVLILQKKSTAIYTMNFLKNGTF